MCDICALPPSLENRCDNCKKGVCTDRTANLLRIQKKVMIPSSLKTMLLSTCKKDCALVVKNDPKFFSYERVYMRRRARAIR